MITFFAMLFGNSFSGLYCQAICELGDAVLLPHNCVNPKDKNESLMSTTTFSATTVSHPDIPDKNFRLNYALEPVDWCEAENICQVKGYKLAVGKDRITQKLWSALRKPGIGEHDRQTYYVWMSARRLGAKRGWTWINENLDKCVHHGPGISCQGLDMGNLFSIYS